MFDIDCRACGKPIQLREDRNGWPSLAAAAEVAAEHRTCLRRAAADGRG